MTDTDTQNHLTSVKIPVDTWYRLNELAKYKTIVENERWTATGLMRIAIIEYVTARDKHLTKEDNVQ